MELTKTGQEQKEDKKPARQRADELLASLGIVAGGTALNYKKHAVYQKYREHLYPGLNKPDRQSQAVRTQPGTRLAGAFSASHGRVTGISGPVIQSHLNAMSSLYPYVDTSKIRVGLGTQESSYLISTFNQPEADVVLGRNAGTFSLAHELGHIAAIQNPKETLSKKLHRARHTIVRDKYLTEQIKNYGIAGSALVGATSNSLLGAIGKGALIGVSADAPTIGSEIAATYKGLGIIKKAGGNVPYGTGLAQVGNYISGSILTPVAMSVTAYGVKKTADALMRRAERNKQAKEKQPQELVY